jgi:hypothetical protein
MLRSSKNLTAEGRQDKLSGSTQQNKIKCIIAGKSKLVEHHICTRINDKHREDRIKIHWLSLTNPLTSHQRQDQLSSTSQISIITDTEKTR